MVASLHIGSVQNSGRCSLVDLMRLAVVTSSYIVGDLAEHSGPVKFLGEPGYRLRNAKVSGGKCVMVALDNLDALVPRNARLPLLLRRMFLEIKAVQYVSEESSFHDTIIRVCGFPSL